MQCREDDWRGSKACAVRAWLLPLEVSEPWRACKLDLADFLVYCIFPEVALF
jgi:hypothetical protein